MLDGQGVIKEPSTWLAFRVDRSNMMKKNLDLQVYTINITYVLHIHIVKKMKFVLGSHPKTIKNTITF